MSPLFRLSLLACPAALAGCATTDAGMVSVHQPVVAAGGASVAGCPDWSDQDGPIHEAQSRNYGCATALNLAAMIADPADLVRGKAGDNRGSGEIAVRAVKSARDTPPSGKGGTLQQVSSKGN